MVYSDAGEYPAYSDHTTPPHWSDPLVKARSWLHQIEAAMADGRGFPMHDLALAYAMVALCERLDARPPQPA